MFNFGFTFHEIPCACIDLLSRDNYKFIVFSEIDRETCQLKPKYSRCPHCDRIHHVSEIGQSKIVESSSGEAIPTIDTLKINIPENIMLFLKKFNCGVHIYESINYLVEKKEGDDIILNRVRDNDSNRMICTVLRIAPDGKYKIFETEYNSGMNI